MDARLAFNATSNLGIMQPVLNRTKGGSLRFTAWALLLAVEMAVLIYGGFMVFIYAAWPPDPEVVAFSGWKRIGVIILRVGVCVVAAAAFAAFTFLVNRKVYEPQSRLVHRGIALFFFLSLVGASAIGLVHLIQLRHG